MRTTTTATKNAWLSGQYVGTQRPMVRATIQRLDLLLMSYGDQQYSSVCFGQKNVPVEIPNIKSVTWARTVDQGVATMSMVLYNTMPLPLGEAPQDGDLDQPGFFSPQRGVSSSSSRWTRTANGWQDWIVPDRIIRTYEGYGFNTAVIPELDTHLYQSGTWRVDTVAFTTDGLINVTCRDVGSVLIDQIAFPPVVPYTYYPVHFETFYAVANPDIITATGTGWVRPSYSSSSNIPWVGNSPINGHVASDAFDTSDRTYWMSIGNGQPRADYSFEWVEGKFSSRTVTAVSVKPWGGPYRAYISVYAGGKWQGSQTIPYNPHAAVAAPNGSNIAFVQSLTINKEELTTFKLPAVYAGATKVRVTLTNLYNSGIGPYVYRAGVRSMLVSGEISTTSSGGTHAEPKTTPPGIGDYTDVIKLFLAWAGFYWPKETTAGFETLSDGTTTTIAAPTDDAVLGHGRVWGDIQQTGTSPIASLGIQQFDKKPILDCIRSVVDVVGGISYVDETGGFVFRLPNVFSIGNWIGDGGPSAGRTTDTVVIDEKVTLISLSATLDSSSIREKIFVANVSGQLGAVAAGHNPYPSGLRRISGFTDQGFATTKECQIMADLIALRQLFTYRTDKVQIPGNPAIQIDDQVRLYERISEEGYLHYVTGITMNWSAETGKYTYDLATHWLGDAIFSNWTFQPTDMSADTQAYLHSIGKI